MSEVTRFFKWSGGLEESPDGDYVLYGDYLEALEAKDREIAELNHSLESVVTIQGLNQAERENYAAMEKEVEALKAELKNAYNVSREENEWSV